MRSTVYREVREQFRPYWANYYDAKKDCPTASWVTDVKAEIIAEQHKVLTEKRDAAYKELRESREAQYQELLGHQREIRAGLRTHQTAGHENAEYLQQAKAAGRDLLSDYRSAAAETVNPEPKFDAPRDDKAPTLRSHSSNDIAPRFGVSMGSVANALFFALMGSTPAPRQIARDAAGRDLLEIAAEETTKQRQQQHERQAAEEASRDRERPR